jgi:cytoskeleton protein RodZ
MTADVSSENRCGIGTRLRTGRELTGLTVLQAAEKLHIDPKMLEALESERFASLGASVYVRGHLRHYAELIGERFEELLALYDGKTHRPLPDLTHAPRAPRTFDRRRLMRPALFVLAALVLAIAAWWVLTRRTH